MADYSVGEKILEERLFENDSSRPSEPDHVTNLKRGVVREAYELFLTHFGASPVNEIKAAAAPGRVNLIGEHIDYCDGFVLPMAIPLYTVVVGRKTYDQKRGFTNVFSSHFADPLVIRRPYDRIVREGMTWGRYIQGVFALTECSLCFDVVVHSSIPLGSGLSSSAALELATYHFVSQFFPEPLPRGVRSAELCRRVEHEYAEVPCGIMDQFVIALAEHGHALRIDCRSLSYELIPISISHDALFLIVNSGVHHKHASGEYAKRRKMVEEALRILNVDSWRSVTHEMVQEKLSSGDAMMFDCALHVVDEIERTVKATEALLDNDITHFGRYMCESHNSLRDKYRVSCAETDELVSLAMACEGVFGSRMTGGGFGGCTVSLVRKENLEDVKNYIKDNYKGGTPTFYESEPVSHAGPVKLLFLGK
ncbi:galactokinase [Oesophagostomum dentatum]|uniref:Galactokinase n=1 Tax=Oesophagostomum dentatum TaxID=61180 RepID=A0A0B1TJ49_OESDE|nr:galactokinase [Oesophagostomum dentatum]